MHSLGELIFEVKLWPKDAKHYLRRVVKKFDAAITFGKFAWTYHFDSDYLTLLELMRLKLERMEKRIRNGNHVGCEQDADDIKTALSYLDNYFDRDLAIMNRFCGVSEEKWGKSNWGWKPLANGMHELLITYDKAKNDEENEQASKDHVLTMQRYDEYQKEQLNKFFNLVRDNIEKWWD